MVWFVCVRRVQCLMKRNVSENKVKRFEVLVEMRVNVVRGREQEWVPQEWTQLGQQVFF